MDLTSLDDVHSKSLRRVFAFAHDLGLLLDHVVFQDAVVDVDAAEFPRGVRGPEYAWANAVRLQSALAQVGVLYRHHIDLAPTTELRHVQYAEDARRGVGKRSRVALAPEYRARYEREILDHADLPALLRELPAQGAAALLCVERDPEACHRSLIASRLAHCHGMAVTHLRP